MFIWKFKNEIMLLLGRFDDAKYLLSSPSLHRLLWVAALWDYPDNRVALQDKYVFLSNKTTENLCPDLDE
jgi:hypothetical protein